ncbi:MAG: hypothetical protein ABEJ31_06460 [Haloarculaceae archaeon]
MADGPRRAAVRRLLTDGGGANSDRGTGSDGSGGGSDDGSRDGDGDGDGSSGNGDSNGGDTGNGGNGGGNGNGDDGNDGGGSKDGGNDGDGSGGNSESKATGSGDLGWPEKTVMAISAALTVVLFAYAGWQLVAASTGTAPTATVVGTDRLPDGSTAVHVRLHNGLESGLVSATVESACDSPPPSVQFQYVPADGVRQGTIVCPANATDPNASVANWIKR